MRQSRIISQPRLLEPGGTAATSVLPPSIALLLAGGCSAEEQGGSSLRHRDRQQDIPGTCGWAAPGTAGDCPVKGHRCRHISGHSLGNSGLRTPRDKLNLMETHRATAQPPAKPP